MSLTVSIKFINGKIWVFLLLALLTTHHFSNLCTKKIYNQYFFQLTYLQSKFSSFINNIPLILKMSLSYSDQAQ